MQKKQYIRPQCSFVEFDERDSLMEGAVVSGTNIYETEGAKRASQHFDREEIFFDDSKADEEDNNAFNMGNVPSW